MKVFLLRKHSAPFTVYAIYIGNDDVEIDPLLESRLASQHNMRIEIRVPEYVQNGSNLTECVMDEVSFLEEEE